MKITIIGANSYIARNFIWYVQNNIDSDTEMKLYDFQENHVDGLDCYERVDYSDKDNIRKIDFNSDMIYIFAGKTGSVQGFEQYETFVEINELILLKIIEAYRLNNGTGRLIFPSTRLVYKGRDGLLKEDAEKEFKTIYAINKYSCENYLWMYNNMYGIPYTVFRICLPYGTLVPEASSYGTAEFFMKKATAGENITLYGDGKQRRTITYMEDLCEALYKGGSSKETLNGIYNIGGEDYSLYDCLTALTTTALSKITKENTDMQTRVLKIALGLFGIAMMISLSVSQIYSIITKSRDYGIRLSNGVTKKDMCSIIFMQNIIQTVIPVILSMAATYFVLRIFFGGDLTSELLIKHIFTLYCVPISLVVTVIVVVMSSVIPAKLMKKTSVLNLLNGRITE